jgi:toxin FitB
MIVLDTNVVSEGMKPAPDKKLIAWLAALQPSAAYLSVVSAAEMLTAGALQPAGKRRDGLTKIIAAQVLPAFEGRLLEVDLAVSYRIAEVTASACAAGNYIDFPDAAIVATALVHATSSPRANSQGASIQCIQLNSQPGDQGG